MRLRELWGQPSGNPLQDSHRTERVGDSDYRDWRLGQVWEILSHKGAISISSSQAQGMLQKETEEQEHGWGGVFQNSSLWAGPDVALTNSQLLW